MKRVKPHPLITGTIVLTITGFITRIIGFFYRIYLSRLFGEEGMGIYQLVNPVLSLSFSLCSAGYQTAISKFVAERTARKNSSAYRPMLVGLSVSLPLSLLCTGAVFCFADPIATRLLMEPRTLSMLRVLAFSIPLSAVHACINGYFYGMKKTTVPAMSQLLEQLTRVGCVYLMSVHAFQRGSSPSIDIAVFGLLAGEFLSMMITVLAIYHCYSRDVRRSFPNIRPLPHPGDDRGILSVYRGILGMALPLTANRLVLNFLQSVESVSIPSQLKIYGYDTATALSVYGVLTGMAMPLIFFPNAVTGSISVLLLPTVSENYALGRIDAVKRAALRTVKYGFLMGFVCMAGFGLAGRWAGTTLFDSALAGHFIVNLSFICPFIYLDTILSSILQGLGMAGRIFLLNVTCLLVRLGFIFLTIPRFGITGYLWGILASQLLQCVLYLGCLYGFLKPKK